MGKEYFDRIDLKKYKKLLSCFKEQSPKKGFHVLKRQGHMLALSRKALLKKFKNPCSNSLTFENAGL